MYRRPSSHQVDGHKHLIMKDDLLGTVVRLGTSTASNCDDTGGVWASIPRLETIGCVSAGVTHLAVGGTLGWLGRELMSEQHLSRYR